MNVKDFPSQELIHTNAEFFDLAEGLRPPGITLMSPSLLFSI